MVRMLASENAMQRGSTAAAATDAIAAISRVLAYACFHGGTRLVEILTSLGPVSEQAKATMRGKITSGVCPLVGRYCAPQGGRALD
jgi:hypothetical protein